MIEGLCESGIVPSAGVPRPRDFREPVDVGPASDFRELSEDEIFSLVRDIDRDGYAVLPRYILHSDIDVLRQFVRDAVDVLWVSNSFLDRVIDMAKRRLRRSVIWDPGAVFELIAGMEVRS